MEDRYEVEFGFDIGQILLALKERMAAIIALTLVAALLGWSVSTFLMTEKYEASINMIVNTRTDMTSNITNDNISSAQNLVDTYAIIIKGNHVLNRVIDTMGLSVSYETLYDQVSVNAINNTQVMKIAVQSTDAALAKGIVETIAQIAPDIITEAVEAGSCKVVSDVYVNNKPVFPDVQKNTIVFGLLGMLLSIGFILIRELLNDYIVDDTDVEKKLGIPALGIIPDVENR